MCIGSFGLVIKLEIGELLATNCSFLLVCSKGTPRIHVVDPLLREGVRTACELRVFAADFGPHRCIDPGRVLGPINETDDCAPLEVTETVGLIHNPCKILERQAVLFGNFVDNGLALGANVKEKVSIGADSFGHSDGRGFCVDEVLELLKFLRAGCAREKIIPAIAAHADGDSQIVALCADIHRPVDCLRGVSKIAEGIQLCGLILTIKTQVNEENAFSRVLVNVLGMSGHDDLHRGYLHVDHRLWN